ncbi:hypothetical protein B0H16DRAFT_1702007 [Mycena metata]|uniref:Uncharacterized protein n=1 Tax=Mycena metata TaxID=1033252 RepID=A0AAD7MFT3_9AGAR|nr:hypothetical protein B0H16DRAFT_1702007 [Mycena metata]
MAHNTPYTPCCCHTLSSFPTSPSMNTEIYPDDEDIPTPAPDEDTFTSFGGGMFADSHHFTLAGGTFNNNVNTNNYITAPAVPADFRMIPLGDIDLRKELVVNRIVSTIGHGQERNCVRRVYSAKIEGRRSKATVAVYEGNGAEEDWRRDIEMYMSVRRVWASTSYGNIHATVFHGGAAFNSKCTSGS